MIILEDTYGDVVKKAREGLGLSHRTFADRALISVDDIVAAEKGVKKLPQSAVLKLGLNPQKLKDIFENKYSPKAASEKIGDWMRLKQFQVDVSGWKSNAYAFFQGHYVLLIDAIGGSTEAISYIEEIGAEPLALLITHGHFDHIAGVEEMRNKFPEMQIIAAGKDIEDDLMLEVRQFKIQAVKTPGHSADSVCYIVNNRIAFVGDTIFAGSIGKANYDYKALLDGIRQKIFTLPDDMILAAGHGPLTTVGQEKKHNPFF